MGLPVAEQNRVATLIPEPVQGKSPPIKEAIEKEPRLKALYEGEHRELLDIAMKLEGLNRHAASTRRAWLSARSPCGSTCLASGPRKA